MMINVGKILVALRKEIKMINNDINNLRKDQTYEAFDDAHDLAQVREGIVNAIKIIEDLVDEELNDMEKEYEKEHGKI